MAPSNTFPSACQSALEHAVLLHQQGQLPQALARYQAILLQWPGQADALLYAGLLSMQINRPDLAVDYFQKAIAQRPTAPELHFNAANALLHLKRFEHAIGHYGQAIQLRPESPEFHYGQGLALAELKQYASAIGSYDQAIALNPAYTEAHHNRAILLSELGQTEAAISGYRHVIGLNPANVGAHCNLGSVMLDLKRPESALEHFNQAIQLAPDDAIAHNNQGIAYHQLDQFVLALESFDRAIALQPGYADAYNNRGGTLRQLHRYRQALHDYGKALALHPGHAQARNNMGIVLSNLGQHNAALACYDEVIASAPQQLEARHNRARVLFELKRYADAAAAFEDTLLHMPTQPYASGMQQYARLHVCDWSNYNHTIAVLDAAIQAGQPAVPPFAQLAMSDNGAKQLRCARIDARYQHPAMPAPLWRGERYSHPRIRLAYLSADFHAHATAYLTVGLFEQHDRSTFDITALSFGPLTGDSMQLRLQAAFERFIDVRDWSDLQIAQWLRDNEIDIAIDLKGYTTGARTAIFTHRPAPLQLSYLGYPGTMGLACIDYIIADPVVIPPGHEIHFSEQVIRLPHSYQVNDSQRAIADHTPERVDLGLPADAFVFCCFNNNYKITPTVFDVWMRLLAQVPLSVLWLLEDNAEAAANLRREATLRGIDPTRLVFAPRAPQAEHLARHRQADLFLDTLPYNAHTTASDALWAGLPVLTCTGDSFASRVAASLLLAVGMPELVTHSLDDYHATALRLATHTDELAQLKAQLAIHRTTHPLFDTALFCKHIEQAYASIHRALIAKHSTHPLT